MPQGGIEEVNPPNRLCIESCTKRLAFWGKSRFDRTHREDGCIIDCLRNISEKSVLQNVWVKNKSGSCWNSKGR